MSQSFTCPNCSAPLDYDGDDVTVRCPYCNSSVIVPESLRSAAQDTAPHTPSLPVMGMDSLLSQAMQLKEIARLIRSGNKIEAIRIYRETFDVSLTEAKGAIEKMEMGQPVVMPGSGVGAPPRTSASVGNEAFARAEISRLVQLGNKIEAIKLYREKTGAGLKEAKEAVETFEAGGPLVFVQGSGIADAPIRPVATSTVTTTATASNRKRRGSFLSTWIGASFGFFWVAFTVAMVSEFGFTGLVRFAAPVVCPDGYTDAYGGRVSNYYDAASSTSVDGGTLLRCVNNEGQVIIPHPLAVFAVMFGGTWIVGIAIAFGLASLSRFGIAGCVPLLGVLFVVAVGAYFYNASIPGESGQSISIILFGRDESGREDVSVPDLIATVAPLPTLLLGPTPTPEFAPLILSFGKGEGSGPGFFDDTRAIAVDGDGNVYTADYSGGRIQVFDSSGEFVNQWKIEDDNVYISGMAANREGTLFVVYGGGIYRFDGATGEALGKLPFDESRFEDVAVSPFGDLAAAGSDTVAVFDREGNLTVSAPIPVEDARIEGVAVDSDGNLYLAAASLNVVIRLSPQGKLLDLIGSKGSGPGKLNSPSAVAVDGQGNLYVNDFDGVEVFDADGNPLALLPIEGYGFDLVISDQGELFYMDRNAAKVHKFMLP